MNLGHLQYRPACPRNRESGYMLIVMLFLMTALAISALAVAESITQQIKRDRETEMIHRGVQYARAIKHYYTKWHRYPATLEALEDTDNVHYLRKRYKDPLTKDGKWALVRYGQIQMGRQGGAGFTNSGQAGLPNVPGVTNMLQGQSPTAGPGGLGQTSSFGQSSTFGQTSSFGQTSTLGQNTSTGQGSILGGNNSAHPDQTGTTDKTGTANPGSGTTGDTGSGSSFGSSGTGFGQSSFGATGTTGVMGGGAIIGVASMSKAKSIRVIADKDHYNQWVFIYDPYLDRRGLITGPYDPKKAMGFANNIKGAHQIGVPAGQAGNSGSSFGNSGFGNSSFGNNSFGNSGNSFGSGGFGQQPQQPAQPVQPNRQ